MIRGKVILVPFPFDVLATEKARPAICLTEPLTSHRHIVLAFVTRRTPDDLLDHSSNLGRANDEISTACSCKADEWTESVDNKCCPHRITLRPCIDQTIAKVGDWRGERASGASLLYGFCIAAIARSSVAGQFC